MPPTPRILVIDDEEAVRDSSKQVLTKEGFEIVTAQDGQHGLEKVKEQSFDIILLDLKMPGLRGEEVLQQIKVIDPEILVIIITGYASVESAVETLKQGAYDYVPKPFTPDELRLVVRRAFEKRALSLENLYFRDEIGKGLEEDHIIGHSPAAWAIAGICSSKLVLPPKAAWVTIALCRAASVRIWETVVPDASRLTSACAERLAISSQIGCPEGARAEWVSDSPNASPTIWLVAAVPKN